MDSESEHHLALRRISTTTRDGGNKVAAARERSSLPTAASFRVYYSLRPGAVPFLWESAPGTPKSAGAGSTASVSPAEMAEGAIGAELPPISPPPSYHSSQLEKGRRRRERAPCPAGCVLSALRAALGISRSSRRRPASRSHV